MDVKYNELWRDGTILGTEITPATIPIELPTYPEFTIDPNAEDVDLSCGESITLDPGNYGVLVIGCGATVVFTGGEYTFKYISAGCASDLIFEAPCTIMVEGNLRVH